MNFCKQSDEYISQYIDDLLDDKIRIQFIKHLEGCSECAAKLKEASLLVDLCREDQGIQLPDNFSESLHSRLIEISEKESNPKFSFILHNKKLFATLSTAAVFVIFVLAYNLLPHMGPSKDSTDMKSDKAQATSAVSEYSGSSIAKESLQAGNNGTADSAANGNTAAAKENGNTITAGADVIVAFDEKVLPSIKFNKSTATGEANSTQAKQESNSSDNRLVDEQVLDVFSYVASIDDAGTKEYFSNYVEKSLKVSPEHIEIEALEEFMKEAGAIELKSDSVSSKIENSALSTVTASAVSDNYIDYYLPLSIYSTLDAKAKNYKLELNTKTDIINKDITDKYNELNNQIIEIDKNIEEALKKGESITAFENEKTILTEEMNKVVSEKEMITIRVFFVQE